MEISVHRHSNGNFSLSIELGEHKKVYDISKIILDIVEDDMRSLQNKLEKEEKYNHFLIERGRNVSSAIAKAYSSYAGIFARLRAVNEAISDVVLAWRKNKDISSLMHSLDVVRAQNSHFIKNDDTLQTLENVARGSEPH